MWFIPIFDSSAFALIFPLHHQAGLLGCETVLSSMALMQANNIPGQKRMTSTLGQGHRASPESHQANSHHSHNHHGHQVHHGQAHHSHVGHPSTGSCPPLVRQEKEIGPEWPLKWFLNNFWWCIRKTNSQNSFNCHHLHFKQGEVLADTK